MTGTEARPATAGDHWLDTADHKRIGLLTIGFSLVFLLVGGVLGVLWRGHSGGHGELMLVSGAAYSEYFRTFSAHATIAGVLFLGPLWMGLATYVVPLQIGAARLALPRLHAFALWLYVVGGGIVVAAYISGPPNGLGLAAATPTAAPQGGANDATTLWITGLLLVALAMVFAAVDLAVTVMTQRTQGMSFDRLPLFSWATFVTAVATVLSTPVFVAGLVLLYMDQHLGGPLFAGSGGLAVWQHSLWLYGRPEIHLLLLPGLGAACDLVATHSRRPLLGDRAARAAITLFAVLSFASWASGGAARAAIVQPTSTALTDLVALPVTLVVLLWLATPARGEPRFHVSLLFVLGAIGLLTLALANEVIAGFAGVTGTAWTTAHVHVLAFGAPTLLAFGALYHWAPKLWGRGLSAGAATLVFLLSFGGFVVNGLAAYLLGYRGAPFHTKTYSSSGLVNLSRVATAGGALVALGALVLAADVVRAWAARRAAAGEADPYEGLTLEWAAASPPPAHNFDSVPEVRSAQPLLDLRPAATGGTA